MIDLTVARRYAKALLTLGKEDGKYKEYGDGISGFAHLLQREPELQDALLNPVHSREDRHKLLLRMIELLKMPPMVANLLQLMFDKHRLRRPGRSGPGISAVRGRGGERQPGQGEDGYFPG